MSQSRYWVEAMQLIGDPGEASMQKYESRVPMALHNAKIHRPSVYISAKVKYSEMLEFEELAGRIPRSNLPSVRRGNKSREPSNAQTSAKTSSFHNGPKLDECNTLDDLTVRSLVCSRCKLSAVQDASSEKPGKSTTKKTIKKRQPKTKNPKAPSFSKPAQEGQQTGAAGEGGQEQGKQLGREKGSHQNWRVSEKTTSGVNRLISLLRAIDDLPRKKMYTANKRIGYQQQPAERKRRAKLSKPGRMANAGELFFLQAGELSLRNFLVKEDEELSGLLHVSSKRPSPPHTARAKNGSSAGTSVTGRTAAEKSERARLGDKNGTQCSLLGCTTKRRDLKASSECTNSNALQQVNRNDSVCLSCGVSGGIEFRV